MSHARRKRSKITTRARSQPDPCKASAPPAPAIPIPYPNIARSSDAAKGSKKVKTKGKSTNLKRSNFRKSVGDEESTNTRSQSLRRVRKSSRLRRKTG